jgi:hypothetical protein
MARRDDLRDQAVFEGVAMSVQPNTRTGRGRKLRVGLAIASGSVAAIGAFAATTLAATPEFPPPTEPPPIEASPLLGILHTVVQVAPIVALILAVLFRARLRADDGRRIGSVLAIRLLPLVGLATLALGVAAVPVCARMDGASLLPGLECMVPGVVLAVVGLASFILHAPLARALPGHSAAAAWLAVGLSLPAILGYSLVEAWLRSVPA